MAAQISEAERARFLSWTSSIWPTNGSLPPCRRPIVRARERMSEMALGLPLVPHEPVSSTPLT